MIACTLSTSFASNRLPCKTPPPSTSSESTPRPPSSRSSDSISTWPFASVASTQTSAPAAAISSRHADGDASVVAISVFPPGPSTFAPSGVRPRESATMRNGCSSAAAPPGRAVSRGSSSSTLLTPHMIASTRVRKPCAQARASSPATQRESPLDAAILPSSVAANFAMTNGSPIARCFRYASSSFADAASPSPAVTSIPAARSFSAPRPATFGSGSMSATCTAVTPASISASAQGGVRPTCEHGSSVTYAVAPRAASPA